MATYHVDLINGDDANDGSTWALAWLTLTKVYATAANGDTIKFAKNAITDTTVNAQWTYGSDNIVTASALTKIIDPAYGSTWTVSANVTGGSYTQRKLGSNCQQLTFAAGFTTGKAAYKALGSAFDLSAFTKVSMWAMCSINNLVAGTFKLCLCSDTTGDTPINSFPLEAITGANVLIPFVFDNAGALGSSIQSIAIYCDSDPSTATLRVNDIFACNDVTLNSFISKQTEAEMGFYPIRAIVDDVIYFDRNNATAATAYPYEGITELVSLKIISGAQTPVPSYSSVNINTSTKTLIFVGGYNTGSDEVDGISAIDGRCCWGNLFSSSNTDISNFLFARYAFPYIGAYHFDNCYFSGNTGAFKVSVSGGQASYAKNCNLTANQTGLDQSSTAAFVAYFYRCVFRNNNYGVNLLSCAFFYFHECEFLNIKTSTGGIHLMLDRSQNIILKDCSFDGGYYSFFLNSTQALFEDCTILASGTYSPLGHNGNVEFRNCDCTGALFNPQNSNVFFDYCLFTSVIVQQANTAGAVRFRNHNRVLDANSTNELTWQTTVKQGTDPGAWYFQGLLSNYYEILNAITIAEIAVEAGVQTTIRLWVKRFALVVNDATLIIKKDVALGITEDITSVFSEATISWRELGISVIPTVSGVIKLQITSAIAGSHYAFYLGSLSITA